jgi:plastocyanin
MEKPMKPSTRLALVVAFAATCVLATARASDETKVAIDNFVFSPAQISVKKGTRVVFVNRDDIPHSVVTTDGKIRSKALDTDDSFAFVFDKPGEFVYFCGLHPHMRGTIMVTP